MHSRNLKKFFKKNEIIIATVVIIFFLWKLNSLLTISKEDLLSYYSDLFRTRDFIRYDCKILDSNEPFLLCQDKNLKIEQTKCNVLTFRANNNDYSFEKGLQSKFNCKIDSFDPFHEAEFITDQRKTKSQLQSTTVELTKKWKFHRIGLNEKKNEKTLRENSIGMLTSFSNILNKIEMVNQTIDVLQMDIKGAEWDFIENFDIKYACKYIKQFLLKTHPLRYTHSSNRLKMFRKLEECFFLYRRNSRLFENHRKNKLLLKELLPGYKIDEVLSSEDEIDLIDYLFLYGELSFANKNFL